MKNDLPQLFMRHQNITNLPRVNLPKGFSLHTHLERTDSHWEAIIEKAFGTHYSFEDCIKNADIYHPEHVLYLSKDGLDIATVTAVEKDSFPGEGWFRMVGVIPEARGLGAGKLICLSALHSLAQRGYKSVVLSTDDHRIPAIRLYLALGFEPLFNHESHMERWNKVFEIIDKYGEEKIS